MGPLQLSHLTPLLPLIPHLYSEDNKGQGLSDGGGGLGGVWSSLKMDVETRLFQVEMWSALRNTVRLVTRLVPSVWTC